MRILCAGESFDAGEDVKVCAHPDELYKLWRMIIGLPEGSHELGD